MSVPGSDKFPGCVLGFFYIPPGGHKSINNYSDAINGDIRSSNSEVIEKIKVILKATRNVEMFISSWMAKH